MGRSSIAAGSLLCAVLAAAGPAPADDGVNLALFKPVSGGDGLTSVEGARPLGEGDERVELKLWFDGSYNPVARHDGGTMEKIFIENRFAVWTSAQIRLFGPLALALQVPVTISEFTVNTPDAYLAVPFYQRVRGMGDVRITPRLGLLRQDRGWPVDFAVQGSLDLPTAIDGSLTGDGALSGELLAAGGRRWGAPGQAGFEMLVNLFGRLRPTRAFDGLTVGSAVGGRLGLVAWTGASSTALPARVQVELAGQTWGEDRRRKPMEWRAGFTWCFGELVSFDLGAGTWISVGQGGYGAPQLRVVGGLGFTPASCSRAAASGAPAAAPVALPPPAPVKRFEPPPAPAPVKAAEPAPAKAPEPAPAPAKPAEPAPVKAAEPAPVKPAELAPAKATMPAPVKPVVPAPAKPAPAPAPAKADDKAAADAAAFEKAIAAAAAKQLEDELGALGPPDADGDGVPDATDNCPREKGTAKNFGCKKKQVVALRAGRIDTLVKVKFAKGKATVEQGSFQVLEQLAAVLREHPELTKIEVQGKGESGSVPKDLLALAKARAQMAIDWLAKAGIASGRMVVATGSGSDTAGGVEFRIAERAR